MDPLTNPTPTPNPAPGAAPNPGATPNPGAATPAPDAAATPGATAAAGTAATPGAAAASPAGPAASNPTPATAAGGMTTPPVNPIINPTGGANETNLAGAATQSNGFAATDPIMMPEPAKAPDPVEEELKAPMKAAAPVPGSIGSAVSGPAAAAAEQPNTAGQQMAEQPLAAAGQSAATPGVNPLANNDKQTPSVAFNDPAMQPDPNADNGENAGKPAKKKNKRTTLIALIAVAVVIVVVLLIILIMQINNNNSTPAPVSTTPNNTISEPVDNNTNNTNTNSNTGNSSTDNTTTTGTLSCTRNMTEAEIARINGAVSGTLNVSAEFNSNNTLNKISLVESVVYSDSNASNNEPVENAVHEALAEDLTTSSASIYYLPVNASGSLDLSRSGIQANYESLAFTCKVL